MFAGSNTEADVKMGYALICNRLKILNFPCPSAGLGYSRHKESIETDYMKSG